MRKTSVLLVLLVVLLLATLPVVAPALWRVYAYNEHVYGTKFVVRLKMVRWGPGEETVVPPQVCIACLESAHNVCFQTLLEQHERDMARESLSPYVDFSLQRYAGYREKMIKLRIGFQCTCQVCEPAR